MSSSRSSIRFRLAALFVALFGTTLIVFSSVLYNSLVKTQQESFDIDLYNHAVDVAGGITVDFFGSVLTSTDVLSSRGKIVPFSLGSAYVQILNLDGQVLAASSTLRNGKLPFSQRGSGDWELLFRRGATFRTLDREEIFPATSQRNPIKPAGYRMISYLVSNRPAESFILLIAVPTAILEQSARGLRTFLLFGIPVTLVIATFLGLWLSGRALRPVNAIVEKANELSPMRLSERVPVPEADDELRSLSLTLNRLLDRLQQAFESQERFIADASHELKTPLAILRGELDLMKSRPRSAEEVTHFLDSASQELDQLSRVVDDLLLLARVDAGAGSLQVEPTRLDEAVLEVVSRLELLAKKRNQRIQLDLAPSSDPDGSDSSFEISADGDLARVLVKNLIENALKFSPEGSSVEVRVAEGASELTFSVRDHGPGIPTHLQSQIFERFYRIPGAERAPGAGLGLAIARRIIQAHGGSLEMVSEEGRGATFLARFPRQGRVAAADAAPNPSIKSF